MKRETRRGLRVVISVLNMVIQLLMLWIIVRNLDAFKGRTPEEVLLTIQSILTHISIMMGSFFIYYTVINLMTRRNIPHNK